MRTIRSAITALLLLPAVATHAETGIRSIGGVINGHSTGGVTIDAIGNLYVADFGETLWKVTPDGRRHVVASSSGLYGASGNTIDTQGNLLQASFYGDAVTRFDRKGQAQPFVTSGLSGPVGVIVNKQTGEVYVANCRGQSVARIATDGTVSSFAKSDLFKCPNGIAFDRGGNLYTVNYRDNKMLKIDPQGVVSLFATVSEKGLGHLCFKDDRFYVTASQSHEIYEVTLQGNVKRLIGNGERGIVDGAGARARLSFPNGVACHPWAPRLYINEFVNESTSTLPPRSIIREIVLDPIQ